MENTGRTVLLAGLALVGGILIARRQVSPDARCTVNYQCRNCGKLSTCALPEAETERHHG
jgi:hypothetical protein